MPQLTYVGSGNACDTYSYTMELAFSQPGDSYGNGQSYGLYQSPYLSGNANWTVDWSLNYGDVDQYSEGGIGSIDVYDWTLNPTDPINSLSFVVYGQNPLTSSITAFLNNLGPPWWYGHTLTWETLSTNPTGAGYGYTGNVQFYGVAQFGPGMQYTGTPVWGYPDGFGLSQLDGSTHANPSLVTDNSLWTWTTNLMYGVEVANRNQTAAYSHFQQQLANMLQATGGSPEYPSAVGGYCNLTWNGTGNNAYWNADWINLYNGGTWETWNGSGWSYGNSTNPTYTTEVCNSQSWTI
jgi:hypothetical protein